MTINHAEALRKTAAEIRTEGHNGWGNTCEWAAEAIDASQAEIERLRKAHLSIGELPSGMVSKIVSEIVSWGDQCAGGSGREIIPSGPNEGKPYGHTYYEAVAALGALFEDARAALSGSKE